MIELIAENSSTGDQTTAYEYGVTLANSATANNDALRKVIHPDEGEVVYSYDRAGQQTSMTDQNGTIHVYVYDKAGRMTADVVTALGSGVDSAVQRINRGYDNRGRLSKVTSFSSPLGGSGNIVNEIQYNYNGFNQIVKEFQQHGSAVNMSTSPVVEYGYADGSNNTIRMTYLKYPDGSRQIDYDYGASGSQNDRLSRVENLNDSEGSLTSYHYAGIGQIISAEYSEPDLTYSIPGGSSGGYTGLDRFGRLTALQWKKGTAKPLPSSTATIDAAIGCSRKTPRLSSTAAAHCVSTRYSNTMASIGWLTFSGERSIRPRTRSLRRI